MTSHQSVTVIGAGISGLTAARRLLQARTELGVTVIDAGTRSGGMVETEHWQGLTIDHGPEGVITTKPEALDLIDALGMTEDLVVSGPAPRRTFIARDGQLRPLPYGILNPTRRAAKNLLLSGLLSPRDKLRIAAEPLIRRRRELHDESVGAFVRRRFGQGMLDSLVDPLIGGIHGDSPDRLSAEMLIPALRRVELQGRSVAFHALRRGKASGAERLPPLVTLKGGMGSLTDRLASDLGDSLRLGERATAITRDASQWLVHLEDGPAARSDGVIVAIPCEPAADLLRPHDAELAAAVGALPSSPSQTVTLIWSSSHLTPPQDGTGFLVPRSEQRHLAACTWTTAKWHHRSEDNSVMVRCYMRAPGASDDELISMAREELAPFTDLSASPKRTIVRQVPAALPVMEIGHQSRVAAIHEQVARLGLLALAGAGLCGSGLPACIRSGNQAADNIISALDDSGRVLGES